MPIIGLCGNKGSGKDTIADSLVVNDNYVKIAFADFIRNALKQLFDWDDNTFSQDSKEIVDPYWGVTPRKMCQELGTEFLRFHCKDFISKDFNLPNGESYSSTFHIKRINKEIVKFLEFDKNTNIVFSDIRFQDELDYVKKLGGKVMRVSRNSLKENVFSSHISEKNISELKDVDFEIENNDTKNELFKRIKVIVECIEEAHHQNHLS